MQSPERHSDYGIPAKLGRSSGFAGPVDDAAHRFGGLSTFADPVVHTPEIDIGVLTSLFRVVVADDLDELAITRAARICNNNFVIRAIGGSFAAKTD